MVRCSYELKKKIAEEYLCGKTDYQALAMKYQIEKSVPRSWINNYESYGDEDLMRSRNNRAYNVEFKSEAIICCETDEYGYQQSAPELGLTNPSMIVSWRRQRREKGIERLLPHKRGRPVAKKNDRNQPPKTVERSESIDTSTHEELKNRIKESEAKNREPTIQRMFRKQLGSSEEEESMNKGQRLSPNSEDNSN